MSDKDLEYMAAPEMWVLPVCPLKRFKGNNLETGYLLNQVPTVFLGNIGAIKSNDPVIKYDSLEEVVSDGWRVD